jgi:hypothetical protein
VIERLGRLPVPLRIAAAALAMGLATAADLTFFVKTSPVRIDVAIAAALGALAAWPFAWRARTRVEKGGLMVGIAAFAAAMVWARLTGHIASPFAFVFSVVLLSLPVQRARGSMEPREAPHNAPGEREAR